ncbi:MAG TPA: hypothetical protein VF930_04790 [Stellaceae bacterium]
MKDADHFRAQAARCLTLQRRAKRADVQTALRCLAREYEAEARAIEGDGDARGGALAVVRLPLAWPMLAMHRHMAALLRASFAFWLSF